jgi:hypothetical protein
LPGWDRGCLAAVGDGGIEPRYACEGSEGGAALRARLSMDRTPCNRRGLEWSLPCGRSARGAAGALAGGPGLSCEGILSLASCLCMVFVSSCAASRSGGADRSRGAGLSGDRTGFSVFSGREASPSSDGALSCIEGLCGSVGVFSDAELGALDSAGVDVSFPADDDLISVWSFEG